MSATRDNTQKVAFVFSNLYSIYQKGKTAAQEAVLPAESGMAPEVASSILPPSISDAPVMPLGLTTTSSLKQVLTQTQAEQLAEAHAKAQFAPFVVTPITSGPALVKSGILKADDLHKPEFASVKIADYAPATMIGKRVARPQSIAQPKMAPKPMGAVAGLKENLKALNDLHSRLRFMLQELEELVRK